MLYQSPELCKDSLQIKQHDKFYSGLLSRESTSADASLRVYYGVATGSVPFLWESEPGTPKNSISSSSLPPLSPPPSYFSSSGRSKDWKKSPKSSLIHAILPKLILRKFHKPSSSWPSPSESSTSATSSSSKADDGESDDASPTSTLCFRVRHGANGGLKSATK